MFGVHDLIRPPSCTPLEIATLQWVLFAVGLHDKGTAGLPATGLDGGALCQGGRCSLCCAQGTGRPEGWGGVPDAVGRPGHGIGREGEGGRDGARGDRPHAPGVAVIAAGSSMVAVAD